MMNQEALINEIVRLNEEICNTWSNGAWGWAPKDASILLEKSRLDRQVSLSYCLKLWMNEPDSDLGDGQLILAWANLGALVEGAMKWFLCVYEGDYSCNPIKNYKGTKIEPDELFFRKMSTFFKEVIWTDDQIIRWFPFVEKIRSFRNAIHSYQDHPVGTFEEFWAAVEDYRLFLKDLHERVPWPDYQGY